MKTYIKKTESLIVPQAATLQAAGYDVVVLDDPKIVGIQDGEYWKSIDYIEYHTGLFIAPQTDAYNTNYHTLIFPRSSVRKYNLVLANSIGLVDNDYRGEIILCFKYIWQPEDFVILIDPNTKITNGGSVDIISDKKAKFKVDIVGKVNSEKIYKKGDKIGQLVSDVTNTIDWVVVADLTSTARGEGGFGHTDQKKQEHRPPTPDPRKTPIKTSVNIVERWKEAGDDVPVPQKYESVAREREKLIP